MRQLLPCTRPQRPWGLPATARLEGFQRQIPTWWGEGKEGDTCEADSGAAPLAWEDVHGTKTQRNRREAATGAAACRLSHQPLDAKIRPTLSQVLPWLFLSSARGPIAEAQASFQHSQLRVSGRSFASVPRLIPHFLSDLQPQACRGLRAHDYSRGGAANDEAVTAGGCIRASRDPEPLPILSTESPGAISFTPFCEETSQGEGKCDLLRLQCRFDALLRNPHAFSMQLQLLHACIQGAQEQHAKSVYLKKLQPLQERIRTPGTNACLQVHPLLYAAFCMYSPSHIHIAATMRVGAAEHFLGQYLRARSNSKAYRRRSFSDVGTRGRAAAEQWLSRTSLSNICIYPLEALSPQLRLFPLTAPQRLAAWQDILSRALSC